MGQLLPLYCLTLSLPKSLSYEGIKVILTSVSVDEILSCDHSNETSSAVLSQGTNNYCILVFYKMKFGICLEFCI